MNPVLGTWVCALTVLAALAGIVAILAHQARERKRLEVHHDGRAEPAVPAPAVTLPASVAAPVWPAPPVVEPYEPARFTGAAGPPAVTGPAWAGPFAAIDPYVTGHPGLPVADEYGDGTAETTAATGGEAA